MAFVFVKNHVAKYDGSNSIEPSWVELSLKIKVQDKALSFTIELSLNLILYRPNSTRL